ncbi:hypothetical protein GC163_24045 [bacterium]|nr:hypothetical protein [bacterium]
MAIDSALIERIVANVLEQLQPAAAVRPLIEPVAPAPVISKPTAPVSPAELGISDRVVTAAVLEKLALPNGVTLLVSPKAVITPSAHDVLKQRKIRWTRTKSATATTMALSTPVRWQILVSAVTPTVRTLLDHVSRSLSGWRRQLVGTSNEVIEIAGRAVSTADVDRVLILAQAAELVACETNRNAKVRAAVISSAEQLRSVETQMSPNVWVLNPQLRSYMELRQIVQACAALGPSNISKSH